MSRLRGETVWRRRIAATANGQSADCAQGCMQRVILGKKNHVNKGITETGKQGKPEIREKGKGEDGTTEEDEGTL